MVVNCGEQAGSPVKQQGEDNGRVLEIRDTRKVSPDEDSDGGRIAPVEIRYSDNVASIEAGTPIRIEG